MLKLLVVLLLLSTAFCHRNIVWDTIKNITQSTSKAVISNIVDIWYYYNRCEISTVVFGKTGVGKSTLINSLFGLTVAETGDFSATTKENRKYSKIINDVMVHIYDTPGLFDENENDIAYLTKAAPLLSKCDIILLCFDVREKRLRREDIDIMNLLTLAFGKTIWNRIVIVYTFADEVNTPFLNGKLQVLNNFIKNKITTSFVPIIPNIKRTLLWATIFERSDNKINAALVKINFDSLYKDIRKDKESAVKILKKIQSDETVPVEIKQKLKAKISDDGCFASSTMVKLCNSSIIPLYDVKVGDYVYSQNYICTRVRYIKHHTGYYYVYDVANVWITRAHLIKINNDYVRADSFTTIKDITYGVTYILTADDHIMINDVIFSVHSYNHYIMQILSRLTY